MIFTKESAIMKIFERVCISSSGSSGKPPVPPNFFESRQFPRKKIQLLVDPLALIRQILLKRY